MYILHVTPARGRSYSKTLQEEALVIGRSLSCDLIIEDQEISRRHAILALENDQLFLEDLDSHNGTLLNEKQVTGRVKIKPESTIRLSGNTITVTKMDSLKDFRKEPTKTYGEKSLFRDASDILNQRETQDVQTKDEKSLRVFASRLSLLNEVHADLCQPISSKQLIDLILERTFKHLKPEEASIYLKDENGDLFPAARRTAPELKQEFLYSQTLIEEVAENGLAALVSDLATDKRFSQSQSMVGAGIRSLIAAPLLDSEGSLGMIALASRAAVRLFSEQDMDLLVWLANLSALRIRNLMLIEDSSKRLRDANLLLEQKVAERTGELEEINEELRKKNEEILRTQNQLIMQEKMASLGTMAAGVAHEIKNPLNFVQNLTQISKDLTTELKAEIDGLKDHLDPEAHQRITQLAKDLKLNSEITHSHGVRADQIVKSLMEFTQERRDNRQETELNGLVEKYAQLAYHGRKANDWAVEIEFQSRFDPKVGELAIFPGDLSRTILNLVNNAIDSVSEKLGNLGSDFLPVIQIETERRDKGVFITIKDNGLGIPEKHKAQLFTPFFSTKRTGMNIGLGLALSYDTITQGHQGTLTVESEEGKYAKFTIFLPQD